jgi:hypothetical protein
VIGLDEWNKQMNGMNNSQANPIARLIKHDTTARGFCAVHFSPSSMKPSSANKAEILIPDRRG